MADTASKQKELVAIMFLDMVGYSVISHRDEDLAQTFLAELKRIVRLHIAGFNGREVRTMGDGFLIEFANALNAVDAARAMQMDIHTRNLGMPPNRQFQARMGIHLGEVVREGSDILGHDVNIASRVEALAAPGGICFTQDVRQKLSSVMEPGFVEMGPTQLRNIRTPISLYQFPPVGSSVDWRPPKQHTDKLQPLGLAFVALLVAALFFSFLHLPKGGRSRAEVAILPFRAISSGDTDEALGDGFCETLAARLTQMQTRGPQLRVVPMSEVRGRHITSPGEVRSVFGATHALTGSIERNGQMVRVNLALVDALSKTQLQTCTTNGGITNLFALQDGLALTAAGWLGVVATPPPAGPKASGEQTATAYEQYLLGVGKLARYDIAGNVDSAIRHFENALAMDQNFAAALVGLAEARWYKHNYDPTAEWTPSTRLLAKRALSLNTNLARAYVVLGLIAARQGASPTDEIAFYHKALAVDPFDPDAWSFIALACERGGRQDEMAVALRKVVERNPQHWTIYNRLGLACVNSGNLSEAASFYRKAIALAPDCYLAQQNLGVAYLSMGKFAEAEKVALHALKLRNGPEVLSNLGNICFFQGRYREAHEYYLKATQQPPAEYDYWGNLGDACSFLPYKANEGKAAYEKAVAMAEGELRDRPEDAVTRSYLAWYLASLNRRTEAMEQIEHALKDAPFRGEVNFNAALIYEICGQRSNALNHLKVALTNKYPKALISYHPTLAPLLESEHNAHR